MIGGLTVLTASLAACSGSSGNEILGGGSTPLPILYATSSGLSTAHFESDGYLIAFTVNESDQGHSDLNGDGDVTDSVLHVYDGTRDKTYNLGYAANVIAVDSETVAFGANEFEQGQDFNGDGDQSDSILHSFNTRTNVVTNHQVSLSASGFGGSPQARKLQFRGGLLVTTAQATDLAPATIQVLDPQTNRLSDTGFESFYFQFGRDQEIAAFLSEAKVGHDLNLDGDTTDLVAHIYDGGSGSLLNLGVAPALSTFGPLYRSSDDFLAIIVNESLNGDTDFDGDGLTNGLVLFVYDYATRQLENTRIKIEASTFFALNLRIHGQYITFVGADNELQIWDALASVKMETGLRAAGGVFTDQGLVVSVFEALNAADYNADGDQLDQVVHFIDFTSGTVHNLGFEGIATLAIDGKVLLSAFENPSKPDLNGDGDHHDNLIFSFDPITLEIDLLRLPGIPFGTLDGENVLSFAFEIDEDLNEDGDFMDEAVLLGGPRPTQTFQSLRLARAPGFFGPNPRSGLFPILVNENSQGQTDLNGDGDTLDNVLHYLAVSAPFMLRAPSPGTE